MSLRILAALAAVASLATAKPINTPQSLSAYTKRDNSFADLAANALATGDRGDNGRGEGNGRGNGRGRGNDNDDNDDFNVLDNLNNFNDQEQVIQIQQNNLQIIDDGDRQVVVQQVQQVLIVDQAENGARNDMKNMFRKSNYRNKNRDVTTVILVVQEIEIVIDDGRGTRVEADIFAQNVVVANRGARETQTVMVFDERKLVAQEILDDNAFERVGGEGGVARETGARDEGRAAMPTKTMEYQLFDAKPTWEAVEEDPAAELAAVWEEEMKDLQRADNDEEDNRLNEEIAALVIVVVQGDDQQDRNDDRNDDQKKAEEEQKAAEEAKAAEEEQKKQEEEQKKAEEEQKKQEEEQKKAEEEQKKQEEEQKKQEEEQKKQEEEQKKQEEEQKKQQEEQQKQAEEAAKAE
ncbi:hypothetical protein NX059_010280 [Plenodomus lindquistii]|nr:hypothetical protein NX059_010280 [Plenodomus lindquistii]